MAKLSVKCRGTATVLDQFRQSGALKCLFPRLPHRGCEAVLVNTAGGVTGGDRFNVTATAQTGTELTLTTQACERAYRALDGQTGRLETHLRVEAGARVNWLPQETLLFDGCRVQRRLRADLDTDARFLMVEPLVFGRHLMGETLTRADFSDRIEIRQNGRMLYLDAMRLSGDLHAHLSGRFVANGAGAMASLVYVSPDAEALLEPVRDQLADQIAGASLLAPNSLVMRFLAQDSFAMRQHLLPILRLLRGGSLPRCWTL